MKVIIIDDDQTTISFLTKILQKHGIQTAQAKNGLEALDRIEAIQPDLIISDIMMPELDGFGLYSKLRTSDATADIPFIFLSAKDDPADQLKGLRMGADEYLVKPFNSANILTTIDNVMEKAARIKGLKDDIDIGGNLAKIGLEEIIQIIELSGKDGKLVLLSSTRHNLGTIYIRKGKVINALTGNLEGDEAFFELMAQDDGFFTFHICNMDTDEKISKENMVLFMEASRLKDDAAALFSLVSADARLVLAAGDMPPHAAESISAETFLCIADLIRRGKTVDEITNGAGMSRPRVAVLLAELIHCGVISEQKPAKEITLELLPEIPEPVQGNKPVKGGLVKMIKRLEETRFSGRVYIRGRSKPASIDMEDGMIVNAAHGKAAGKKALFRIFSEHGGKCIAMEGAAEKDRRIHGSLADLISEAGNEVMWRQNLKMDFSTADIVLNAENIKKQASIQSDTPALSLLEFMHEKTTIQDILDASPFPDLETCSLIDAWYKKGILQIKHISADIPQDASDK